MARKKKGARVLGPYKEPGGFRVIAIDEEGNRSVGWYETKEEAIEVAEEADRRKPGSPRVTVKHAVDAYGSHLSAKRKKNRRVNQKSRSVDVTTSRLNRFIGERKLRGDIRHVTLGLLKQRVRYRAARTSFDTLAGDVGAWSRLLKWCYRRGWVASATIAGLEELWEMDELDGERNKGKPQLRIDEARLLLTILLATVSQAATAVLCILLLGLRSRELLDRVVRDLDDDGWILVIEKGKTRRSNRKVRLTPEVRERLQRLARGRKPNDPLFPARVRKGERLKGEGFHYSTWLNDQVKAFCRKAGVPEVCVHGLRGTHASLAEEAGETAEAVASALGHTSSKVTHDHYTMPDAVASARQRKALKVLAGGQR
jgi:integrase